MYSFNFNDIHVSNICFNDACLHTLSTVISTWSKLCKIYFRICLLSRPEVVTEPALHRRSNDNFRWRHWHRSWHCDSSRFSTHYAMSLCNVLSWDLLSSEYRKDAPWLARKDSQVHLFMQEHGKRKPWRVIIPSKYQLTIIYTKCWLSLSHWDGSILLSYISVLNPNEPYNQRKRDTRVTAPRTRALHTLELTYQGDPCGQVV